MQLSYRSNIRLNLFATMDVTLAISYAVFCLKKKTSSLLPSSSPSTVHRSYNFPPGSINQDNDIDMNPNEQLNENTKINNVYNYISNETNILMNTNHSNIHQHACSLRSKQNSNPFT